MKKALLPLVLFFAFIAVFILQAFYPFPENKDQQMLDKSDIYNAKFPQEKIYLHTDRSSYWTNDDIWFKAYFKDSPIPECNFYVELLNGAGTIVQKKLFWAQNGLAYGDLHASDTLSSGVYQIRAYTSWMRNFEDQWFFRKDLVILNPRDKRTFGEISQLKEDDVDIQFFPEGGTFLAGVNNKVAFKATDNHGKGLDVEGNVLDEKGNEIARFKSQFRGMGNFTIKPEKGIKYFAEVIFAGDVRKKVKLPMAEEFGVSLSIDPSDSVKLHVHLSAGLIETNPNDDFLLVALANGVVVFKSEVKLINGICNLAVMKDSLPQGIVQFTLFDRNIIPQCERLVFINHHDYIDVVIHPDQENYTARGKVKLQLTALPKSENPMPANLSVSVFNQENQMITDKYPGNILTYFLLNSELKGLIEDPAWYFKDDSLSTRLALDNLMLTHGYRHFEWQAISEDRFPKIDFPTEPCLQIRGTVTSIMPGKPLPNCMLTMMLVKTQYGIYSQNSDSLGHFVFSNLYFYNDIYFTIQAVNQKGKRNTSIELDRRSSVSPPSNFLPLAYQYNQENTESTVKSLLAENEEIITRKWKLSDTILLNNVNVVAYKKKKGDGNNRMYVDPDYVYDAAKHDQVYGNIIESLENDAYMMRYINAQYYLDGVPVDPDFIASLPVSIIDKVEVVKIGAFMAGGGPGVFFYLKRGERQKLETKDAVGMLSGKILGYSVSRKFYSPNYETPLPEETKKDFRSTLYWNPIVQTDTTGVANVSFYNSDQTGDVDIVVEGVTADGKLCRGVGKYKVEK
jgi:hypothetical protein